MFNLHGADHIHVTEGGTVKASGGFTAADLIALGELHATATARHLWSRGEFVSNEFAHYLAVWGPQTDAADPPALALARFKKTGTYALTIGTTVVASGKSLSDVLPALSSGFGDDAAATSRWR
jgi:hypothetical protein